MSNEQELSYEKELQQTIQNIGKPDEVARTKARKRLESLCMPHWALGRVLDLCENLSAISGEVPPPVARRTVVVMAADHGVAAEGVSQYPQEVTAQMVGAYVTGGAGINAIAKVGNAHLELADFGVKSDLSAFVAAGKVRNCFVTAGSANFAKEPALTRAQALQALVLGIRLAKELAATNDLLATGEMGIANTTSATAILCAITGVDPLRVTGAGTGLQEAARQHKADVIRMALRLHKPNAKNALDILCKVGGLEIAGIAGFYLGAAAERKPIVVDGFICSSGALLAQLFCPRITSFMVAAHRSVEPGHGMMLETLGLSPLLELNFRLGEGTGAAMSFPLFDAARAVLTDMASFAEASVSEAEPPVVRA